jgi:hypothetical protein
VPFEPGGESASFKGGGGSVTLFKGYKMSKRDLYYMGKRDLLYEFIQRRRRRQRDFI